MLSCSGSTQSFGTLEIASHKTRGVIVIEVHQIAGIDLYLNSVIQDVGVKDLADDPAILRMNERAVDEIKT